MLSITSASAASEAEVSFGSVCAAASASRSADSTTQASEVSSSTTAAAAAVAAAKKNADGHMLAAEIEPKAEEDVQAHFGGVACHSEACHGEGYHGDVQAESAMGQLQEEANAKETKRLLQKAAFPWGVPARMRDTLEVGLEAVSSELEIELERESILSRREEPRHDLESNPSLESIKLVDQEPSLSCGTAEWAPDGCHLTCQVWPSSSK